MTPYKLLIQCHDPYRNMRNDYFSAINYYMEIYLTSCYKTGTQISFYAICTVRYLLRTFSCGTVIHVVYSQHFRFSQSAFCRHISRGRCTARVSKDVHIPKHSETCSIRPAYTYTCYHKLSWTVINSPDQFYFPIIPLLTLINDHSSL